MAVSEYREYTLLLQMRFSSFPPERLAKAQAGLFLLEAQSDDRVTLLQLCLFTRNTEVLILASKLLLIVAWRSNALSIN